MERRWLAFAGAALIFTLAYASFFAGNTMVADTAYKRVLVLGIDGMDPKILLSLWVRAGFLT